MVFVQGQVLPNQIVYLVPYCHGTNPQLVSVIVYTTALTLMAQANIGR